MLSYQHLYHAGNGADCHKHAILTVLLQSLMRKETPLCYRETHAGRGLYDLTCAEALKTDEARTGILSLLQNTDWPDELQAYRQALDQHNTSTPLQFYPGSPLVTSGQLREKDRMYLYEYHPQEYAALEENCQIDKRITCHFTNGWEMLTTYPAPQENRGLTLIDPSYELKEDYDLMAERMTKALKKWRNGVYAIWYPLLPDNPHHHMYDVLIDSSIRNIFVSELAFFKPHQKKGMYGSGMAIVNPPWQSDESIQKITRWLTQNIGYGEKCFWLIPE